MDSSDKQQELSTPLLEDIETAVAVEKPLDEDEYLESTCWDHVILWFVLPSLLFVQFAISFLYSDETPHHLQWSTVNWSIGLFVVASYLFRRTLQDHCVGQVTLDALLFLLPEIIMDVLLGMVLFGYVEAAFLTMVFSTVLLSFYVVCQSLYTLFCEEEVVEETEPLAV